MATDNNTDAVLFLLGTLERGGSETKFVRLANRLTKQGRSVHIAYLGPPETLLSSLENVPAVNLGRKGKWSPRAFRNLSAHVRKHSISKIVTANPYPLSYAVPLASLADRPAPKVIASINTSEILSAKERAFMRVYALLLKRCHRVVFGAKRQLSDWVALYGLPGERAKVIYNGVDGDYFDPAAIPESREEIRAALSLPANADIIVCVGRLRPEKAHRNLLEAVAELEKNDKMAPHLLLVGDGSERSEIIGCANRLGLQDRLHMAGSSGDVRPYLKAADVFALTSTAVETFSNAALEAASMGLPVITSDVGGAKEMFPADSKGTVYPRHDISALAGALAEALGEVRSGSRSGTEIRHDILTRFSIETMDESWVETLWGRHSNGEFASPSAYGSN